MSIDLYKKHLTSEQVEDMKISERMELERKENTLAFTVVVFTAITLSEVISVIAAILWMNKFTLFISLAGLVLTLFIGLIYKSIAHDYKKTIKSYKEGE